ncbi:MAG: hypothetical protein ABI650_03405, partial [Dokdonella sp.]
DGGVANVGAATWGNGVTGSVGTISAGNSLIGSSAEDQVGASINPLNNGHYVVSAYYWDNGNVVDAGAVTWGNGVTGTSGVVGPGNSLVGSSANDAIGGYVHALRNGHFVINSPDWNNGVVVDAGASTWVNGTTGAIGPLGIGNSLIGGGANHRVGAVQVTELTGGDYVVDSPFWDNGGIIDAGASTWRSGTANSSGTVSASNSLVGSSANDRVGNYGQCGYGSTALSNGHYVVRSSEWDNGAIANVGAVTWRNGAGGSGAVVSTGNSLVGTKANDRIGCRDVVALNNGNYVVDSPDWDNVSNVDAGASTWRSGTGASGAVVSLSNSLIGNIGDNVGYGTTALSNGHYVVRSYQWRNGAVMRAGALTWGNGVFGSTGVVSSFNSVVGSQAQDYVGNGVPFAQVNGNYVGYHPYWNNGALEDAGAITLSFGDGSTVGVITASNSVRGTAANAGSTMNYAYDAMRAQLVVGRPASNLVSLLRPGAVTSVTIVLDTPDPSAFGGVVTIVTTVVASPAPTSGSVRIAADTGETCTDVTPMVTSSSTSQFSCQLVFASLGQRDVRAEFLGTQTHGYSASGIEPHNVDIIFRNGFE